MTLPGTPQAAHQKLSPSAMQCFALPGGSLTLPYKGFVNFGETQRKEGYIMIVCPWKDLGRYTAVVPGLEEAMKVVAELTDYTPRTIPLSDGNRIMVQQATTKSAEGAKFEAHRNYLDIQYIVKGEEYVGWAPLETLEMEGEYNAAKDKATLVGHADFMRIGEGYCYVVYPEDAHIPGAYLENPCDIIKLVVKLKV